MLKKKAIMMMLQLLMIGNKSYHLFRVSVIITSPSGQPFNHYNAWPKDTKNDKVRMPNPLSFGILKSGNKAL